MKINLLVLLSLLLIQQVKSVEDFTFENYRRQANLLFICFQTQQATFEQICNKDSECFKQVQDCKTNAEQQSSTYCQNMAKIETQGKTEENPFPTSEQLSEQINFQMVPRTEEGKYQIKEFLDTYKTLHDAWKASENPLDRDSDEYTAIKAQYKLLTPLRLSLLQISDVHPDFAENSVGCLELCEQSVQLPEAKQGVQENIKCFDNEIVPGQPSENGNETDSDGNEQGGEVDQGQVDTIEPVRPTQPVGPEGGEQLDDENSELQPRANFDEKLIRVGCIILLVFIMI